MNNVFPYIIMILFSFIGGLFGETDSDNRSLKQLAELNHIRIGTAVAPYYFAEPDYVNVLTNEFDTVTPENQLKWAVLRPEDNVFDFSSGDSVVAFAVSNKISVRGHNLVWHFMNPDWLDRVNWTKKEITNLLCQHIKKVVKRYKGTILEWDVVNEPLNENGKLRKSVWLNRIGPDYIEKSFRWAHEADPKAILFINEYGTEMPGKKADGLYDLLKQLLKKKVPIHGVGFQCHFDLEKIPDREKMAQNILRFAKLGLKIEFTEVDIRFKGDKTEKLLQAQAKAYEDLMNVALITPNFSSFVLWGFTDKYSWVPYFFQDYGNALIFDEEFSKKPAYYALKKALMGMGR